MTITQRHGRASKGVAAKILDAFYSEGLKPGEWLGTEATLAERFNVSRVTIRDAVSGLAARGLIDVRVGARGGLRVATGDPQRLIDAFSIQLRLMGLSRDELFEAMLAIEPVTASLAASRATAADVACLRDVVERSRHTTDEAFTTLAVAFHQTIADLCQNRALRASLAALRATQIEHLGRETTRPIAERVVRIHSEIVDAIAAHDAERAAQRMREHLSAVSRLEAVALH